MSVRQALHQWVVERPAFQRSLAYAFINLIRNPAASTARWRERRFYSKLLREVSGGVIFDVGANAGAKAEIFRRHGTVVCVEPGSRTFSDLKRRFADCENVVCVRAAVGASPGISTFFEFDDHSGLSTLSRKWVNSLTQNGGRRSLPTPSESSVGVTTIGELIRRFGHPKFVKIDVEGSELEVLRGLQGPVPLLSAEFNLPEFSGELEMSVRLLEALNPRAQFNLVTTEPPRHFEFNRWETGDRLLDYCRTRGLTYAEVYCRPPPEFG